MGSTLKPASEQVMVLTGAPSAVGLCTAQMAAWLGARVVLMSRNQQMLDSLAGLIASCGGQAMAIAADVRVRSQLEAAARAAIGRFGRIDTWINNGSVSLYGRLDEVSDADSRRLFDVNFWGVVNGSLVALPYLAASGGSLINVGSELGEAAAPWQGMYSSSKCAVKGFTEALRLEAQQTEGSPVSVTLIQPAVADTGVSADPVTVAEAILAAACGASLEAQRGGAPGQQPSGASFPRGPHQPQAPATLRF